MNKIYIDSDCKLCNGYGQYLKYRNSSLILANQFELGPIDISKDQLVYERNGQKYYANEAIVESMYDLGGLFRVFKLLKIVPQRFSYSLYKIFARNRYRFNSK